MSREDQIEVNASQAEAKYQRSQFAAVVFHNVAETYPADAHVECSYKITADIAHNSHDWVGLYKVGWMSARDYIYYEWAPVPKNYQPGNEAEAEILFQAHNLPNDDGEFYQFCYVSSAWQIRGASTPFQFKKPSANDFVEVEDEETDMLVIRSKTVVLQENLKFQETENMKLLKQKEIVQKEVDGLVDKLKEVQKNLEFETAEKENVREMLTASQKKLDEMLAEANDMMMVHDELRSKIDTLEKEKAMVSERISELEEEVFKLQVKIKTLQNGKDELEGKNKTLEEEMNLYKSHLSNAEGSVSDYIHEIELLNGRLEADAAKLTSLQDELDEKEIMINKYQEEICQLKSTVHQHMTKVEEQKSVFRAEKENMQGLREKSRNAEDKLQAAERTKEMMQGEIQMFQVAQDKMSKDLEASKLQCHCMKEQLARMEEGFCSETKLLKRENAAVHQDLELVLKEKEALQHKVCQLQEEIKTTQDSIESSSAPMYVLKKTNETLKERLDKAKKAIVDKRNEIFKVKKQSQQREHDLSREVEDLKERVSMCSEEYKHLYLENKKMKKKLDKIHAQRKTKEGSAQAAVEKVVTEKLQISAQKTPEQSTSVSEVSEQPCEDQQEMVEKESMGENVRTYYQDQLKSKDLEIEKLRKMKSEGESELEHKIRSMESYLIQKDKQIEDLNQKLRASKIEIETPKPAERKVMTEKSTLMTSSVSLENLSCSRSTELLYGNPYAEESKKLSAECSSSLGASVSGSVSFPPMLTCLEPIRYAETGETTLSDLDPLKDPNHCIEQPLPVPMQPTILPMAKVAAVRATLPHQNELCAFYPELAMPSAPPESYAVRRVDENGDVTKECPVCHEVFSANEDNFAEHYMSHFGRICPMCQMLADETVSKNDFEYHVNCCIETHKQFEENK